MPSKKKQAREELKQEIKQEVESEMMDQSIRKRRLRNMWFSFGWIVIGGILMVVDLFTPDTFLKSLTDSTAVGFTFPISLTLIGLVLVVLGVVGTVWAFVRRMR